jgi:hypothetical protein
MNSQGKCILIGRGEAMGFENTYRSGGKYSFF